MTHPPSGPPGGPPWGGYPQPGPQPRRGRGWEIFGGVVVGGIATIVLPLMSLAVVEQVGFGAIIVALLLVPVLGVGLLLSDSSRPWGVGILIGWAVALIVVGGSCVAIIASLSNA